MKRGTPMPMPALPNKSMLPKLEESLNAIIASIAMEEVALGHLITAESEKIQYVIECAKKNDCKCADLDSIVAVNKSVTDLMKQINAFQQLLKEKLAIVSKHIPIPRPVCTSIFVTESGYYWHKNMSMFLLHSKKCTNGVKLVRQNCESAIVLPKGKEYDLLFELEAINNKLCPVLINMEFRQGNTIVRREAPSHKEPSSEVKISHKLKYNALLDDTETYLVFKLVAPDSLSHVNAKISITNQ